MYKGKAIYNPSGRAGEYSYYACNFYVGCSNGCTYCYLKKGIGAKVLGGNTPTLKKCFRNEVHALKDEYYALKIFEKELKANLFELKKHGLFFSFTTDPLLHETGWLTLEAAKICFSWGIPVKILTKRAELIMKILDSENIFHYIKELIAFGFTLTGHDELEPGASTNQERIEAMKKLHDAGFKTFASIEPIIDFESSLEMMRQTIGYCDLYKIGLESGKKYNQNEMILFVHKVIQKVQNSTARVYFKESITKIIPGLKNKCIVDRDYNMFEN